ncbi:MAG: DUF2065 family protein [Rhizobiales bacterium]|nr:DUF2065 family protein [Hyphomicrobiales bacterium]
MTTDDLLTALGLVLVIEGLVWAFFPHYAERMLEAIAATPPEVVRLSAVFSISAGVLIVWLIRG